MTDTVELVKRLMEVGENLNERMERGSNQWKTLEARDRDCVEALNLLGQIKPFLEGQQSACERAEAAERERDEWRTAHRNIKTALEKECDIADSRRENAEAQAKALTDPFTRADSEDWGRLDVLLGDSGHGKFWRAVIKELRAALKGDSYGT